ncbi:MAG TPA: SPFH domain-containing protein [Polyangia bacterium]|jgi:membrane protease subunit (stomatin/prohibitin family)
MADKGFFRRGVSEMMVARPDEAKGLIIYKHPDHTIPMQSQLTVEPDESALFFRDGRLAGIFRDPGRYTLDTSNLPFLSNLVDSFTGGNVFIAEVFFVARREIPEIKFGGKIGALEDPKSGLGAETMVHGSFALQVTDPVALVCGLVGLGRADDNEQFIGWFRDLVLKVIRERIAEFIVDHQYPLLKITSGAYTSEIEEVVLKSVQPQLEPYGIHVTRLGNFVVAIDENDEAELKKLYRDAAYVRMAGGLDGFQQFAAGKAVLGAGEGMARGGEGGGAALAGAGLGVGFGMAQGFMQQAPAAGPRPPAPPQAGSFSPAPQVPPPAAPAPAAPATTTCPACHETVAAGKFCAECGNSLTPAKRACVACGAQIGAADKFCSGCGKRQV